MSFASIVFRSITGGGILLSQKPIRASLSINSPKAWQAACSNDAPAATPLVDESVKIGSVGFSFPYNTYTICAGSKYFLLSCNPAADTQPIFESRLTFFLIIFGLLLYRK